MLVVTFFLLQKNVKMSVCLLLISSSTMDYTHFSYLLLHTYIALIVAQTQTKPVSEYFLHVPPKAGRRSRLQ